LTERYSKAKNGRKEEMGSYGDFHRQQALISNKASSEASTREQR
jgi:hypothetical protein